MSPALRPFTAADDCSVIAPDGSRIAPPKTSRTLGDGKTCTPPAAIQHPTVAAAPDAIAAPRPQRSADLRDAVDRLGPDWDQNGRAALRAIATTERLGNGALEAAPWLVPGPDAYAADAIRGAAALAKSAAHAAPLVEPAIASLTHGAPVVGSHVTAVVRSAGDAVGGAMTSLGAHVPHQALAIATRAINAEKNLDGAELRTHLESLGAKRLGKSGDGTETYVMTAKGAAPNGRLTLQPGARLNPNEAKVAIEKATAGDDVVALVESSRVGAKTPDFLINGRPTELCTVSKVDPKHLVEAVKKTIAKKTEQAPNVIVDARSQKGFARKMAQQLAREAFDDLSSKRLQSIELLGIDKQGAFEVKLVRN